MNVLDFRTYQAFNPSPEEAVPNISEECDLNSIPILERYQMAYARGRCMDILRWFFTEYEIYSVETGLPVNGYLEVAMAHLTWQASVIKEYKQRAIVAGLDDGSRFAAKALEHQISLCFQEYPEALQAMPKEFPPSSRTLSLDWPNPEKYGVRKLEYPIPYQCKPDPFSSIQVPH